MLFPGVIDEFYSLRLLVFSGDFFFFLPDMCNKMVFVIFF